MVQTALGVVVEPHDDNSGASMYDLAIRYLDGHVGAVEVVMAADPEHVELWNVLHRHGRTIIPSLAGGWLVTVQVPTRANSLFRDLPDFLGQLEAMGIRHFDSRSANLPPALMAIATANRIAHATQSGTAFPGSVYFTFDPKASYVPDTAVLVDWVSSFLAASETRDVRKKLVESGASERHVFVLLPPFSLAPDGAPEILLDESPTLPSEPPSLPSEITHVWLTSTWSAGHGMRWSPDRGWSLFTKLQPE